MKNALLTLVFLALSASGFAQMPDLDPSKIEIYITPFYNSEGPAINVGRYSEGLASSDSDVFLKMIRKMRKNWSSLTIEELYVGAIRLYDQEYRSESVYWFYSAQLRSRVFGSVLDQSKVGSLGSTAFELQHAQNSFYQLAGPYINGYAFSDPESLLKTIKRVKADGERFPGLKKIYPNVSFVSTKKQKAAIDQVVGGLDGFIQHLKAEGDSIKQQRIENGTEEKFGSLNNKELTR